VSRSDETSDQPPTWVAFVTLAAAILGVVLAFWIWGALT
jgi:hypothetical protein